MAATTTGAALAQTAAKPVPDFSGAWTHPATGFGPALKGPGPIRNLSRTARGTSDNSKLVGDYMNPILKPEAAEIIRRRGLVSISGKIFPDPDVMCCTAGAHLCWTSTSCSCSEGQGHLIYQM